MVIPFKRFAVQADRMFAEIVAGQALEAAEETVAELQTLGPQWSGEFSNSWKIETRTQVSAGKGQKTFPITLKAPKPRGRDVLRSNSWFVRIENMAPYAAVAMDLEEGKFSRKFYPSGPIARGSKWDTTGGGKRVGPNVPPMKRGNVSWGSNGTASRTADLDWFANFKRGGSLKRILTERISMPRKYSFNLDLPKGTPGYRTRSVFD
tara:strand:+ start:812 stop:1432 length:621 start_codon:yes stop_codon:yes gene_type:complete